MPRRRRGVLSAGGHQASGNPAEPGKASGNPAKPGKASGNPAEPGKACGEWYTGSRELLRGRLLERGGIRYMSIDPGYVSMGVRVEWRSLTGEIAEELFQVWAYATKKDDDWQVITALTERLREIARLSEDVDCFLIEKQGGVATRRLIRIEQHLDTYFTLARPRAAVVVFPPSLRNRAKPASQSNEDWLVESGERLLRRNGEERNLKFFQGLPRKQKTDLAVPLLQCEVFHGSLLVPPFPRRGAPAPQARELSPGRHEEGPAPSSRSPAPWAPQGDASPRGVTGGRY